MKHTKKILALASVVMFVLAIAIPAMAAEWTWRYSDTDLYRNSGSSWAIMNVQTALNSYFNYHRLDVGGYFRPLTEAAVREFQGDKGLTVDGWVGPNTKTALYPYY